MSICKYDVYFIIVIILIIYLFYKINKKSDIKENFAVANKAIKTSGGSTTTKTSDGTTDIKTAIKEIYLADVEAIRNLSSIATKLQAGGLTIPGNLSITGNLNVTGVLNILPSGLVIAYTGATDPIGWLICDGRAILKTTYANLFSIIGVQFGDDGLNFKIPNYTGAFLRGVGGASLALNVAQGDAVQNHTHHMHDPGHTHAGDFDLEQYATQKEFESDNKKSAYTFVSTWNKRNVDIKSAGTGVVCNWMRDGSTANETRPYNFGVNWIIKI